MMFEDDNQLKLIGQLAEGIVLTEDKIGRLKKEVVARKYELIALMQQSGILSTKLDSELIPRLETKQRISKREEIESDDLHSWLAKHDLADIIKPTVHSGTLQSTLEGYIAKGNELPSEMFNQFEQTVIYVGGRAQFLQERNHG
jgi:hypothetical protein